MSRALVAVGIEGPNMTINVSASAEPPPDLSAVSPFGLFVVMQTLLGEIFRRCSGDNSPRVNTAADGEEQVNEHVHAMSLALHRWFQMWLKTNNNASPNATPQGGTEKKSGILSDPIPNYWLAQLLLLAFQEGLPPFRRRETSSTEAPYVEVQALHEPSPFAPPTSTSTPSPFSPSPFAPSPFSSNSLSSGSSPVSPANSQHSRVPPYHYGILGPPPNAVPDAAQFLLVKNWLHDIRLFLRRSQGSPSIVWDELMKIRLRGWQEDNTAPSEQRDALRGEGKKRGGVDDEGSWSEDEGLIGFFDKMRICS